MASTHEEISRVSGKCICSFHGTITTIDYTNETATISTDDYGTLTDIPIFYHCYGRTDKKYGSSAFVVGDIVFVVCNDGESIPDNTNTKIVGFQDYREPCVQSNDALLLCTIINEDSTSRYYALYNPVTQTGFHGEWTTIRTYLNENYPGWSYYSDTEMTFSEVDDLDHVRHTWATARAHTTWGGYHYSGAESFATLLQNSSGTTEVAGEVNDMNGIKTANIFAAVGSLDIESDGFVRLEVDYSYDGASWWEAYDVGGECFKWTQSYSGWGSLTGDHLIISNVTIKSSFSKEDKNVNGVCGGAKGLLGLLSMPNPWCSEPPHKSEPEDINVSGKVMYKPEGSYVSGEFIASPTAAYHGIKSTKLSACVSVLIFGDAGRVTWWSSSHDYLWYGEGAPTVIISAACRYYDDNTGASHAGFLSDKDSREPALESLLQEAYLAFISLETGWRNFTELDLRAVNIA